MVISYQVINTIPNLGQYNKWNKDDEAQGKKKVQTPTFQEESEAKKKTESWYVMGKATAEHGAINWRKAEKRTDKRE